jgi:hypothetical protein
VLAAERLLTADRTPLHITAGMVIVADLGPQSGQRPVPEAQPPSYLRSSTLVPSLSSRQIVQPSATSMCCLHAAHLAPRGSNFHVLVSVGMFFVLDLLFGVQTSSQVHEPAPTGAQDCSGAFPALAAATRTVRS